MNAIQLEFEPRSLSIMKILGRNNTVRARIRKPINLFIS